MAFLHLEWRRCGLARFSDFDHANQVLGLVMKFYKGVVVILMERPEDYAPLLAADSHSNEILREPWVNDFGSTVVTPPSGCGRNAGRSFSTPILKWTTHAGNDRARRYRLSRLKAAG
jgi:hypothetical protein